MTTIHSPSNPMRQTSVISLIKGEEVDDQIGQLAFLYLT